MSYSGAPVLDAVLKVEPYKSIEARENHLLEVSSYAFLMQPVILLAFLHLFLVDNAKGKKCWFTVQCFEFLSLTSELMRRP